MFWCIILVVLAIAYRMELKSIFEKVVFSLMEKIQEVNDGRPSNVHKYPVTVASVVTYNVPHKTDPYDRLVVTFEGGENICIDILRSAWATPYDGGWLKVKKGDVCTRVEIWGDNLHIWTRYIPKNPQDLRFCGNDSSFCVVE